MYDVNAERTICGIDADGASDLTKRKLEAYAAVYGSLDARQTYRIDQMCEMFKLAREAYRVMLETEKGKRNASTGTGDAGIIAEQFMIHLANLIEEYGCDMAELFGKIDNTSAYLIERGWFGLPETEDKDGVKHYKTAVGMCADMKQYMDAYHELVARARRAKDGRKID